MGGVIVLADYPLAFGLVDDRMGYPAIYVISKPFWLAWHGYVGLAGKMCLGLVKSFDAVSFGGRQVSVMEPTLM